MPKDINYKGIIEKVIYGIIAFLAWLIWLNHNDNVKLHAKMDNIIDNRTSISKLWEKYGGLNKKADDTKLDIYEKMSTLSKVITGIGADSQNNSKTLDKLNDEISELRSKHMTP